MVTLKILGYKGLVVLQRILKANLERLIDQVEVGKDKNVIKDYSEEITNLCREAGIAYSLKGDTSLIKSNYIIAIGWRWLIKTDAGFNLIILHDSLLPRYRGFAPVVNALINGENEIGVTALFASEKYDEGDIITQKKLPITYPVKIQHVIENIAELYGDIVIEILKDLSQNKKLKAIPQDNGQASYSLWRDEQDYKINWQDEAGAIQRFVHAVGFPYKGAFTTVNGQKIIVEDVEVLSDFTIENRDPGKTLRIDDGFPIIVCGRGLLKITKAYYADDPQNFLPLKKVRLRFL